MFREVKELFIPRKSVLSFGNVAAVGFIYSMISYLACPYTHAEEHMEQKRYEQVTDMAAKLMLEGEIIYSPITSMHYLARRIKANKFDWLRHDLAILARCDKMIVLQLDGWENSVGLKREIEFANELNIPITYIWSR